MLSALAFAEASKAKFIKKSDMLDTGKDWVNLGNGFGFQPGDLDMKDPRVLAATVEAQNRFLQSKNNSAYENQFIDAADTIYDDYAQAWRLLGFYIDCNTLDYGDDQDNAAGTCVRYLLWAAYVDLYYEGNGVGEYQYYNHKTGIWDNTACKYLNSSRCARMDCHLSNTTFSLLGVFKEPDYHEWMEQLFKHQGVCLWSEDDYELMQDDREDWPEGCTQASTKSENGDYLYYDLKPKSKGRIDVGIYTDSKCSEDYEGDYTTKQVLSSDGSGAYYLESSIYNWSRAFDVFRICQPCKTYDLSYIPKGANETGVTYDDDYFTYAQQNMEGDPFDCFDDADYTNVNQCMKFASKTEMHFATFDDMILASMQGTITPFKFLGRLYGGSQNSTYIDEDRYLAGIESILGRTVVEEYMLENALVVALIAAASVIFFVFCSYSVCRFFGKGDESTACDDSLLQQKELESADSGITESRDIYSPKNGPLRRFFGGGDNSTAVADLEPTQSGIMSSRTEWSEVDGPTSDSEAPTAGSHDYFADGSREYFSDECLPPYKPGYSLGAVEHDGTPVNTPKKSNTVVSQSPAHNVPEGLTPSRLDYSVGPNYYTGTPSKNEAPVPRSPAPGSSAVDYVCVKDEPAPSSSHPAAGELPPHKPGFSIETTGYPSTPVRNQPSVSHSPAPSYSAPAVPESPAKNVANELPPYKPGFSGEARSYASTPVKNQPSVSHSPAPGYSAPAVPESPAHSVANEVSPYVSTGNLNNLGTPAKNVPDFGVTGLVLPETTDLLSTPIKNDTVIAASPAQTSIQLSDPQYSNEPLDLVGKTGDSEEADLNTVDEPSTIASADEPNAAASVGDITKPLPSFD